MVTPVYPASNNQQAIDLNISNANQFFTILQGGIDDFIPTYEGNGEIPSVAKALNEAAAYKVPVAWQTTGEETDLLQPREYNGDIYVPLSVPAPFSGAPSNSFWRLYSEKSAQILIDNLTFTGDGVTTDFSIPSMVVDDPAAYLVSVDGVDQRPTIDYTVNVGTDTLSFTEAPPATEADNISVTILGALRGALAEGIYETVADGLDETVDGGFFHVVNTSDPDAFVDLYKNNAGSALLIDTYPNSVAYNNLANAVAYEADLADNAVGGGSDKMAHTGTSDTVTEALDKRTIFVGSVAELEGLSLAEGVNVYLTQDGRAGEFVVKTGTPPSDPQKGIYIVLANGNYAKRNRIDHINIQWFGAAGDSSTDNTLAIQAAVDYGISENISVFVPSGTYNYQGVYIESPNTNLGIFGTGWGSILVNTATDGTDALHINSTGKFNRFYGIKFADLAIIGNGSSGNGITIERAGWYDSPEDPSLEPNTQMFTRVKIYGHGQDGVFLGISAAESGAGNMWLFQACWVGGNGNDGISATSNTNFVTVDTCMVESNGRDGVHLNFLVSTNNIRASYLIDNARYGLYANQCEEPLVTFNGFNRNSSGAILFTGQASKYTEAGIILGNLFGDNGSGAGTSREISVTRSKGTSILSNYFYGTGQDEMIYLADYCEGVLISGNHFKDLTTETKLSLKSGAIDTWYRFNEFGDSAFGHADKVYGGFGNVITPTNLSINSGAIDLSTANPSGTYTVLVGEDITSITFPENPVEGQQIKIRFKQNGAFTVAGWPSDVNLEGGSYTLSSAGRIDVLTFEYMAVEWVEISRTTGVI